MSTIVALSTFAAVMVAANVAAVAIWLGFALNWDIPFMLCVLPMLVMTTDVCLWILFSSHGQKLLDWICQEF